MTLSTMQLTSPVSTSSGITQQSTHALSPGRSGRRISAPSPYEDLNGFDKDDYASDHEPSFSIHAPSGITDSDSEGEVDYVASSRRRSSVGSTFRQLAPVQIALAEVTEQLNQQLKVRCFLTWCCFIHTIFIVCVCSNLLILFFPPCKKNNNICS